MTVEIVFDRDKARSISDEVLRILRRGEDRKQMKVMKTALRRARITAQMVKCNDRT